MFVILPLLSNFKICKKTIKSNPDLQALQNKKNQIQIKLSSQIIVSLLEKRFIVTPVIHYWCRLLTVADTNNGGLTIRYQ
jgi:hypothetical protein